eukprot:g94.t1
METETTQGAEANSVGKGKKRRSAFQQSVVDGEKGVLSWLSETEKRLQQLFSEVRGEAERERKCALLLRASARGDTVEVKKILASDPDLVNHRGVTGLCALLIAATNGSMEVLKTLCSHTKVDLNIQTLSEGYTPLILCCRRNAISMCTMLIEYDADLNLADNDGLTALSHSVRANHIKVVNLLLANGALEGCVDTLNGYAAIHYACQTDSRLASLKRLVRADNINFRTASGSTLLHLCTAFQAIENVRFLLSSFPSSLFDVDARDGQDETALMIAAQAAHVPLLEALLGAGADAHLETGKGFTADSLALLLHGYSIREIIGDVKQSSVDVDKVEVPETPSGDHGEEVHEGGRDEVIMRIQPRPVWNPGGNYGKHIRLEPLKRFVEEVDPEVERLKKERAKRRRKREERRRLRKIKARGVNPYTVKRRELQKLLRKDDTVCLEVEENSSIEGKKKKKRKKRRKKRKRKRKKNNSYCSIS